MKTFIALIWARGEKKSNPLSSISPTIPQNNPRGSWTIVERGRERKKDSDNSLLISVFASLIVYCVSHEAELYQQTICHGRHKGNCVYARIQSGMAVLGATIDLVFRFQLSSFSSPKSVLLSLSKKHFRFPYSPLQLIFGFAHKLSSFSAHINRATASYLLFRGGG